VGALYNVGILSGVSFLSRMRKLVVGVVVLALLVGASTLSFWAGTRNAASTPIASAAAPKGASAAPGTLVSFLRRPATTWRPRRQASRSSAARKSATCSSASTRR